MKDAIIMSTARTGLAKSFRGSLNATHGSTMGGHVVAHAVERAGIAPDQVEDVVMGCGFPEAATGMNIARQSGLHAGLPATSAAQTVNRFCAAGLQAIAMASVDVQLGRANGVVAGGVESISLVQPVLNKVNLRDDWLLEHKPDVYMEIIDTADIVAKRHGISHEAQDNFALEMPDPDRRCTKSRSL